MEGGWWNIFTHQNNMFCYYLVLDQKKPCPPKICVFFCFRILSNFDKNTDQSNVIVILASKLEALATEAKHSAVFGFESRAFSFWSLMLRSIWLHEAGSCSFEAKCSGGFGFRSWKLRLRSQNLSYIRLRFVCQECV